MGRPTKAVDTLSKHLTKEEYEARKKAEEKLKGGTDKIKPPTHLNAKQKKIFRYIVDELEESEILTNLDIFILENCAISIERLQTVERILNKNLMDKNALRIKESYTKEFFRCCNELSLSPQSRAKLANINVNAQAEREDPLIKALRGEDD